MWKARDIVQAIGRGFSPERAFTLLDDEIYLRIISLEEYGSTPNQIRRLKGRVIGQGGKTRRNIEELTITFITIFGNTIAIIGELENQQIALTAIIKLLRGAEHSTVYRYLNDQRRRLRQQRQQAIWRPIGSEGTDKP